MVKDIIDIAIVQHKQLKIAYSKDKYNIKVFELENVAYSQQYGNNYICGYCNKYKSELTLCIEKIIYADVDWFEIFREDTCAKQDGVYLIICMSDMHLEYELRKYKMGENLQDEYQNEDGVSSWYSSIDVLAYHFIPFYTGKGQREWIPFEKNEEYRKSGFYTFAYILTNNEPDKNGEEYDYEYWVNTQEFPSPWELTNLKANGLCYTVNFMNRPFDNLRIPTNMKVLAYNYCSVYTEKEHSNHWKLADELGIF